MQRTLSPQHSRKTVAFARKRSGSGAKLQGALCAACLERSLPQEERCTANRKRECDSARPRNVMQRTLSPQRSRKTVAFARKRSGNGAKLQGALCAACLERSLPQEERCSANRKRECDSACPRNMMQRNAVTAALAQNRGFCAKKERQRSEVARRALRGLLKAQFAATRLTFSRQCIKILP